MADDNEANFSVGPEFNEQQFKAFADELERRFRGLFEQLAKQISENFAKASNAGKDGFKAASDEARKAATAMHAVGDSGTDAMKGVNKQVVDLLGVLKELGRSIKENVSAMTTIRETNRRASVEITQRTQDESRERVEASRRASAAFVTLTQKETSLAKSASEEKIAADKNANRLAVVAAQRSAAQRVLITQHMLQSIGRLEKGLGTAIAGTARTATAAFSKIFDALNARRGGGLVGAVRQQNQELGTELRRTNNVVETNMRKVNNSFIENTSTTLNKRESLIRNSFIQQETIIKRSALRQEATMASLRKATSTGVAGAVTGRGIGLGVGGLIGGAGVIQFLKGGFQEAVNLNEQMNKTRVVFGDTAQSVIDFASDAVNSLGSTRAEALSAAATFGNLFRAIGLGEKQSGKMSTDLVQLAADLSSFNNVPIEDAFDAIRSGLTGETEPLKRFGVNLNEATLKAKAMELGLSNGKGVLNANAKAQAAYALILEQTTLAQGDFARTADEGANAQRRTAKAAKEFAAAIAGKLMPAANVLFKVLIRGFSALTKMLNDTTSPALKVLKDGLFGAAAGLTAIIAAKGAVEVFKLLGTAIKLSLTPMGALLVGAALLGAGLTILLKRSAPLRAAFDALRTQLADVAKSALDVLIPALQFIGGIIDRDVIPFIEKLVIFLAEHVVIAFDKAKTFIVDVAVPAIVRAAQFVARNAVAGWKILVRFFEERVLPIFHRIVDFVEKSVIPRLSKLAKVVKDEVVAAFKFLVDFMTGSVYPAIFGIGLAFGPWGVGLAAAAAAVVYFWDTVGPVLRPAIEGFQILGEAIGKAFTLGDFSGLGAGLAAAGSGIAKVASTIGGLIVDVLAAAGSAIVSTLKRVFALPNLIAAGQGFLDFVEFVGNTLGKIVTDPRFLTAVTAIGAALVAGAALIAFRFLKGFSEAFLDNLGANLALIAGALLLAVMGAFKFVFTNPGLAALIVTGILAIFKAKALLTGMAKAGQDAGGGFIKGFALSIKKGAVGGKDLLSGMFGNVGKGPADAIKKINRDIEREVVAVQTRLRAVGSTMVIAPHSLDAGKEELAKLSEGMSDARMKGLLLHDSLQRVGLGTSRIFKGLGQTVTGALKGVTKGIRDALSATNAYTGSGQGAGRAFSNAFRQSIDQGRTNIERGFSTLWNGLKESARVQGTSIGKVFGAGVAKAAVGAVGVVAGFQAGKMEGEGGGSGLMSALLGGVTAGAVVGGPFGVAIGAATAGVALLGAAMGRAEADAKAYREEIDRLSGVFKDDLVNAIESGEVKIKEFGDIKIDTSTVLGVGDNLQDTIDSLASKLDGSQMKTLVDALGAGALRTVAQLLVDANGDMTKFNSTLQTALVDSTTSTETFLKKMGGDSGLAAQVATTLKGILAPGGDITIEDFLTNNKDLEDPVRKAIAANEEYLQSILNISDTFTKEGSAVAKAAQETANYAIAVADVTALNGDFERHGLAIAEGVKGIGIQALKSMDGLQRQADATFEALLVTGSTAEEAQAKLKTLGLPAVAPSTVDAFNTHLADVETKAKSIDDLLAKMPNAFADAIAAANGVVSSVTIDEAIIGSESIARSIQDGMSKGGVAGAAEVNEALRGEADVIGKALAEGVKNKTIVDEPTARMYLDPIRQAMLESLTPPDPNDPNFATLNAAYTASVDAINKLYTDGLAGIQPTIDTATALTDAQAALDKHILTVKMTPDFLFTPGEHGMAPAPASPFTPPRQGSETGGPQGARSAPLIGTININGAQSPEATAKAVTNQARTIATILSGRM